MLKSLSILVFVVGISLLFSVVPSAFAVAGSEFSNPTQTNAYASYNIETNDVQVEWDFDTLPADTVCLLKGDFYWYEDLNTDFNVDGIDNLNPLHADYNTYTRTTGFIPLHYSVVSSSPVTALNSDIAEVVPCEDGSIRIDLDVIMSHSLNVNNYPDLEIFLSFYVANSDGSLNLANASRIDEVFVMYAPSSTFDTAAQEYGCGGQIGSTLYIDATGIHGNNGDNCDGVDFKYYELQSNEWVDIGMTNSPVLAKGATNTGFHNTPFFSLLIEVGSTPVITPTSGSDNPPPPPTFGKNANYKQIVENGFCFNGNCADVDNYHTEFPLINATVGEVSNITVKAYNPSGGLNGLKWIQIILGMPEAGMSISEGEVINTFYLQQTEIDKVEIIDKQNLISYSTVSTSIVSCGVEFSSTKCLELSFNFIPQTKLKNNVVAINVMNLPRSSSTNYLNDGIEFNGESLLEPLISYVSASKGGAFYPQDRGVVELTLINYSEDLWQDEYGYLWTSDNYKSFRIISDVPVPQKEPDLEWFAMTRINSNFAAMIIHEQEKAIFIFDSSKIVSVLEPTVEMEILKKINKLDDSLVLERMSIAELKAMKFTKDYTKNQYLYQKDSYDHLNYFGDLSVAEINKLDLEKKLRLQEEMLQQRLSEKAQYSN